MRRPYTIVDRKEAPTQLATDIVAIVISSGVSYEAAVGALDEAEDMLLGTTRPISLASPQTAG